MTLPKRGTNPHQFQLGHRKLSKRIWLPVPALGNGTHCPQFSESLQKFYEGRKLQL